MRGLFMEETLKRKQLISDQLLSRNELRNLNKGFFHLATAIGNAVAILTDVEKRKQYDTYGPEEERMQNSHSRQGHTHYNYTRGFEGKEIEVKRLFMNTSI